MSPQEIARVCHEVNRAYCLSIGDASQPSWEEAPEWQKESAANGVFFHLKNPGAPASASHEAWMAEKTKAGWTYGAEKNPEAKTHPAFLPYEKLPQEQKSKDFIFSALVEALK